MVNHILTVRGRKASVTPRTLVQGTVGQDTLTLDLDSEWNGLNVTVTFVAATTEITPVLTANVCEIPHEVLVDSGEVDVFVLGTRDGKAMRHASLEHKMVVKKSNMSDGSTTADPSISAYRQAYDDAVKATEAANSAAGAAGSTAVEMAKLNKRYETQISEQATAFSTDQIQRANDFSTAQTQRANDFSTAQTQRSHDFDSAMQGYENAFNEAEGERASAETKRDEAEKKRGKAEEKRAQDSKTRLEELAQAKTNAETATGEANTARDEAKSSAADATSAAGKATDAAGLAETAKTNANTAAEEANAAAAKAEAAARKADGAAETAGTAASTAALAANNADTAAGNAESMAEKADASANKADIAAGKANEATVAATNAATKANEVEAKLTGNVLKGKVKETFIHVDDAFPSTLLGIEIEGATEQVTTTGKNLVDAYNQDNEVGYLTVDGSLKADGRNQYHVSDYVPIEPNTTYFITMSRTTHTSAPAVCEYDSSKAFIAGHNQLARGAAFTTASNAAFVRVSCKTDEPGVVQLEKGSIQTAYEPYSGGKPSPSPEYPQEIKVIENPVVNVVGRNLLKVTNAKVTNRGVTLESKDGIFTLSGTATKSGYSGSTSDFLSLDALINKQVIMTIHVISGNAPTIVALNDKYNWVRSFNGEKNELKSSIKYISANCVEGTTYDCKFYLSVEAYDTDGSYYPSVYQQQSFTLPAEHPYLAKLPDGTADKIIVDKDGNVSLIANVQKTVLDGSVFFNDMIFEGIDTYYETSKPIGNGKLPDTQWGGIYDKFVTDNPYTLLHGACAFCFSVVNGILFRIRPSETFANAEGFNNWLKSNPVTSYHADTKAKTYNLGKINLPALPESVSNVWTDAEVTPRTGIGYTRDVNIVVENLESAIASITQG